MLNDIVLSIYKQTGITGNCEKDFHLNQTYRKYKNHNGSNIKNNSLPDSAELIEKSKMSTCLTKWVQYCVLKRNQPVSPYAYINGS